MTVKDPEPNRAEADESTPPPELDADESRKLAIELIASAVIDPLTSIGANAAAGIRALDRQPEVDRRSLRQILIDVRDQSLFAGNVVNRLRTLVHRQDFAVEILDVNLFLSDLARSMADTARSRDITLDLIFGTPSAMVKADKIYVHQIVSNLIFAAMGTVSPTDEARRVTVATCQVGGSVEVTVSTRPDEAVGTREVARSATEKEKSDHLELAIARAFATAQGAKLSISGDRRKMTLILARILP